MSRNVDMAPARRGRSENVADSVIIAAVGASGFVAGGACEVCYRGVPALPQQRGARPRKGQIWPAAHQNFLEGRRACQRASLESKPLQRRGLMAREC